MICVKKNFVIDKLDGSEKISFVNLSSIKEALSLPVDSSKKLQFMCDGFLLAAILSLLFFVKIKRYSFDFTSLAGGVFLWAQANNKKMYVVGAKQDELEGFLAVVRSRYPGLHVVGSSSGFMPKESWNEVFQDIHEKNTDILLVGMGAGLQEQFLLDAIAKGYGGIGFTCGGFIRQTHMCGGVTYYPKYVNKFKLRAFYRMYKEPHTIKRYFFDYPLNFFNLVIKKKLIVVV